eukprot:8987093-Prorocentrum_lima.AAC.1
MEGLYTRTLGNAGSVHVFDDITGNLSVVRERACRWGAFGRLSYGFRGRQRNFDLRSALSATVSNIVAGLLHADAMPDSGRRLHLPA